MAMRMFSLIGCAAALGLAACATPPQAETPPSFDDRPDQCRASEYQTLVGQNRSAIPATPAGATWRVTCSSCAVTMDYNPVRMNITYNDATGVVERVTCG
jgi:hypothetical protein